MSERFTVWAASSPTGLNIICRRHCFIGNISKKLEDSTIVVDIYTIKMVLNPETGERYFSFAPLFALRPDQTMPWKDFLEFANRGVHCGAYNPAQDVVDAYLRFVDDPKRVAHMTMCYICERGPSQEYEDKLEHERLAKIKFQRKKEPECDGKIITGIFPDCDKEQ